MMKIYFKLFLALILVLSVFPALALAYTYSAEEAYGFAKSCINEFGYPGDYQCSAVQEIKNEIRKDGNKCITQCAVDSGSGSCNTCKNYYSDALASGEDDAFSLSCGGTCRERSPGCSEDCRSISDARFEEVAAGVTAAISEWEASKIKTVEKTEEILEKGGTLSEWKEKIRADTGAESEESKTIAECESLMKQKVEGCSTHEGWIVDNAMEIIDSKTDKHYNFQEVKKQDCSGKSPSDPLPSDIHVDTAFLDAQTDNTKTSSYQVVCSINCQWWDCEEPTTSASVIVSGDKITPGAATIMKISDESFGVKEISISVSNEATNVEIKVTKLADKPATVEKAAEKVYSYLEFNASALAGKLEKAKISFFVEKSWLTSNDLKKENIALLRYENKWQELSTISTTEDSKYQYFEAETTGFSYFAIVEKEPESKKEVSWIWWILIGIIVVAAAGAAYYFMKKKRA